MKVFEKIVILYTIVTTFYIRLIRAGCAAGTYGTGGDCLICPSNYYCPEDATEPFQCPPGYTSFDGEAECMEMKQDEIDYKIKRQLFACGTQPGYYCSSTTATLCPDNEICTGDGSNVNCPAGQRCIKANIQEACPTGYYSTSGDSYCHLCLAGSKCPSGIIAGCNSGEYSLKGSTGCSACPIGSRCSVTTQAPERCPPGWYQTSGSQTACLQCTAGSFCPDPASGQQSCVSGTYSSNGATACLP